MRLIDANALKKQYIETDKWGKVILILDVVNAPTIEPVKHGEWVASRIGESTSWFVECSKCHVVMPPVNYTYCPNCGARMDKGGKDECTYI